MRFFFFGLALLASASGLRAEMPVVCQKNIGEWACGPCSVYNALASAPGPLSEAAAKLPGGTPEDRVRFLMQKYGSVPSESYQGRRPRFLPDKGISTGDFTLFLNDALKDLGQSPIRGTFLNVLPVETAEEHLRRVHGLLAGSLAVGFPPVVELRSFGAIPDAKEADGYIWKNLVSHYVVVIGVGDLSTTGFSLRLADSYTGRVVDAFIYAERYRAFGASRDFTLDASGERKWEWIKGYPYLLALMPEIPLGLQRETWHDRTNITLTYACYRAGNG